MLLKTVQSFSIVFFVLAPLLAQPAVEKLPSPAASGSAQSSLTTGPDGRVYLNWQERNGGEILLRFAIWDGQSFSDARTIVQGTDLLANWADFPSLTVGGDGAITVHWMVRRDQRYAYDIYIARSFDEGQNWTQPVLLHKDGKLAEHGFVSFIPYSDARLGVIWLDGREMAAEESSGEGAGHGHGSSEGAMTVRYAEIDEQGRPQGATVLDARVCECCQTDAVATSLGAAAVFRDRSEDEVRDIGIAVMGAATDEPRQSAHGKGSSTMTEPTTSRSNRTVEKASLAWGETHFVAEDGWKIPGCPVNGPRLDAKGQHLAVAWFTMGGDGTPRVKAAFSDDAGRSFSTPTVLSQGSTMGRLDTLLLPDGSAAVALLEFADEDAEEPDLVLKRVTPNGTLSHTIKIATTSARRPSGFPRLALSDDHIYITWTDLAANKIQLARLPVPQ
ncbi:MAG TPA: sialidase family protein [Acidobacteriota bacterium]|nr:sialidase family protein [Acidobacteriota bacterium]